MSEADIQRAVMVALSERGCVPMRINAGTLLMGDRAVKTAPTGFSDLLVLCPGARAVFIEVKAKAGRLRESQIKFRRMVESLGFRYAVVRSVEDALRAV